MKKLSAFVFAILLGLANFGFINAAPIEEGFYCDTDYLESGSGSTTTEEYIYFDSYTVEDVFPELPCPNYTNLTQQNSCAPMAATITIAYFDITKPNLIPDYDVGYYYENKFYYRSQSTKITALKENLYTLMGTNSVKPGTSQSQFKSGMTSYVNGQGYNITYNQCGSTFNLNTTISYIQQQIPIVIFLNSYKFYPIGGIGEKEGEISMLCKTSSNGHVLVAYGFREYKFYKDGVQFRTEKYLYASFGDGNMGYLPVNDISKIDAAYAINIY